MLQPGKGGLAIGLDRKQLSRFAGERQYVSTVVYHGAAYRSSTRYSSEPKDPMLRQPWRTRPALRARGFGELLNDSQHFGTRGRDAGKCGTISTVPTAPSYWRWMGPGGPHGLQSRCEACRTSRVCSIRTHLRQIREAPPRGRFFSSEKRSDRKRPTFRPARARPPLGG